MLETGTILNLVLMGLLLVALWFGVRLDKRLKALRASHEDFARAVHELDDAAIRAHNSLKSLRTEADDTQDLLHGRILAGRDLVQKLEVQTARAEKLATQLEIALAENKKLLERQEAGDTQRPLSQTVRSLPPRQAFDRDMVRSATSESPRQQRARPADIIQDDINTEDLVDKVHISELVVANLNEMIRNLALPGSQPLKRSVEDDLFEAPVTSKTQN